MSKELVIGSNRHETKVAILEDDQLVEVYFQRANEYSLAGSIHKGRVTRVLPGMQSAFVDLGLERDTFLYVSDFFEENEDIEPLEDKPSRGDRRDRSQQRNPERVVTFVEERPEPAATAASLAEAETGEIETEGISSAEVTADEATAVVQNRPESDRNFRDRRGRRSRRRRSRGRGFPESKYAQAPAATNMAATPADGRPAEEFESEPGDVLILPGESLAKYRHASAGSEPLASGQPQEETGTVDPELEREAEEIELADRVFAHRPEDETPDDEEEKLQTVRNDTPAEKAAAESASELVETSDTARGELDFTEPAGEDVGEQPVGEADMAEEPLEEPIDEADSGEPAENGSTLLEPLAATSAEVAPGASLEAGSQAQTATVRDPGSRYMHRVSRRMRRRRNRPGYGSESENEHGYSATGAAPALEIQERAGERSERPQPSITELLKPGQEIIVQIAKEPLGQKGARITSHIALPGRYVVFMPTVNHLGVSRRIASEQERQRLKRILQTHRAGMTGGFIVRTAGEGVSEDEIAADMNILYNLWLDIRQKAEKKKAPSLLHHDLNIVDRVLRDQVTDEFKAVWVDNEELYEKILEYVQKFQPALVNRVKLYTRSAPIFDAFNITQELEKALRPKVWLKSGGYIVINQTEALVAIDINTGKYVGKSNRLEDTIVKTNLEAVQEIVRQIRLRDLGGIIVVDFIDMDERKNRQRIMQALEEAMRADKAPYKILQFNDFGLVAITRKRVKQSLERTLCSPCPYCEGAGYVKSVQTIIGEILVEAQKIAGAIESKDAVLRVNPDVAKVLKASDNEYLEELEEVLKRPVLVKSDPALHHEKFDLA
jgi:Rne/Rng family ribonuclease